MPDQKVNIFRNVDQILLYLIDGKMDSAITLLDKTEKLLEKEPHGTEFVVNFRKFINQYRDGAVFLHELASGNLEINPPDDPLHENYVISQYKQLHSNLNHFTWQMQQIARGDLNQKVSFLGEFSVAFNKMLDALREKKLMEDRIKLQNEQLRELNTEKDKFFSIIAHDLRSPFTSFLGLTQLMTEELPRLTMDQIKMFATGMRSSATNLFRLLENLLEWSLMQRGKTGFHAEPFLLKQKITECLILVLDASLKKNIEIFYDIPVEMEVIADVHMLETVIRNLVSNAVKFTP
ncbi:MAG: HAMP domain-containing sensor histidine kinase, partial [Bacteroidota bacterium]